MLCLLKMNAIRIELYSPVPPDECVSRIRSAMDVEPTLLNPFEGGAKPVIGRIEGPALRLSKRGEGTGPFHCLTATLRSEGSGTMITGKFAMRPFVRVLMAIWFGGLILVGCFMLIGTIVTLFFDPTFLPATNSHDSPWIFVVVPLLLFAVLYVMARLRRSFARRDARLLSDFLVQVLNANERNA